MNPRMAINCIACARILTAAWSIPVPTQNRIMRSCAVSFVVAFAMDYSRRQLLANAAIAVSRIGSYLCAARHMYVIALYPCSHAQLLQHSGAVDRLSQPAKLDDFRRLSEIGTFLYGTKFW